MTMTKEAIQQLSLAEAITAANKAVQAVAGVVTLPSDFKLHSLEQFQNNRSRLRGSMTTEALEDFVNYVELRSLEGACVFVDQAGLKATAVLNMGTKEAPGHADHIAVYDPPLTAAFKALKDHLEKSLSQRDLAEFLEDWEPNLVCKLEGNSMDVAKAVEAVRNITIEGLRKLDSREEQFSETKTLMEQVAVKNTVQLPSSIEFTCEPVMELQPRTFVLRLSVLTGDKPTDKPALRLRVALWEQHYEEMGQELAGLVRDSIEESATPGVGVVVGSFNRGA